MVLPSLFFGTEEIPWCVVVSDLGLTIDGRLRFDLNVTKVCSRFYSTLDSLSLVFSRILKLADVCMWLSKAALAMCLIYVA
jgi:hypothetical protein